MEGKRPAGVLAVDGAVFRTVGRAHGDQLSAEVEVPIPWSGVDSVGYDDLVPVTCGVDACLDGWLIARNVNYVRVGSDCEKAASDEQERFPLVV